MTQLATHYPAHLDRVKGFTDQALEATGYDELLIAGGALKVVFLDDNSYPFKTNPHLKWWAPVTDNPNCWLHYRPGEKPLFIFFRPLDYWHDAALAPTDFWVDHFDLKLIGNPGEIRDLLPKDLSKTAFIGEDTNAAGNWDVGAVNPQPLIDHLDHHRAAKSEYEVACMREASKLGCRGHRAAEQAFRDGATEFEIHLAYLKATGHMEHQLPYGNIIALNSHGSVLHYQALERKNPAERLSFLIDAGAQCNGYAADITRTYAAEDGDFQAMIAAMEKTQLEICARVKPGLDYRELHLQAHLLLAGILADFDVINVSAEEAVASGLSGVFFPHGLGHLIGLHVHDNGGFSAGAGGGKIDPPDGHPFLRLTRILEEDWVMTIEPGIYFIEQLLQPVRDGSDSARINWTAIDKFSPCGGIRIEDNVRASDGACENLTRDAFSAL
ncbi:MAG: Xaa-Pro dipeptidase [Proteobacteria bacterium]|nr:Xaa-Pro dipeptidase [Pseudomonadota bacterium]